MMRIALPIRLNACQMIQILRKLYHSPAHWLALVLAILCVTLQYAGLDSVLRFDRHLIENGQWWLLLSGNFVHLGSSHLWMNLAGLALVVALVWQHYSVWQWAALTIMASLVVCVGLWRFNPEVLAYVGFSGTLHGLIIAGVIADIRIFPRSAVILLFLIAGKLVMEQLGGALPGSESVAGGRVVVDAHLYGAIAGGVFGVLALLLTDKPKNEKPEPPDALAS